MAQEIITYVIDVVVVVVFFLIGRYLVPAIKSSKVYNEMQELLAFIDKYVTGVEQITNKPHSGEEKLEMVIQLATEKANELGVKISATDLRMYIESAVRAMNEGEKTTICVEDHK